MGTSSTTTVLIQNPILTNDDENLLRLRYGDEACGERISTPSSDGHGRTSVPIRSLREVGAIVGISESRVYIKLRRAQNRMWEACMQNGGDIRLDGEALRQYREWWPILKKHRFGGRAVSRKGPRAEIHQDDRSFIVVKRREAGNG